VDLPFISESFFWLELSGRYPLHSIQIGLEGLRYGDGAILLLQLLHQGYYGASHRQTRAVESVDKAEFPPFLLPVAYAGSAGLEIGEIGAGGYLPIIILARYPDL